MKMTGSRCTAAGRGAVRTGSLIVPKFRPAIGNLMTMFDFSHPHFATIKLPVRPAPRPAAVHLPAVFTER